jgi:hypothetical protein
MPAGRLGQRPLARPFGAGPRKSAIHPHPSIQTQRNGSRALSGPRLLSNPQAARMERLWSPAGATSGKHRQISRPSKPRDQAKSVAVGCDWLPRASNGKEGVDGSSPSEGSVHRHLLLSLQARRRRVVWRGSARCRFAGTSRLRGANRRPRGNFERTRCHGRQVRVLLVELNEQLADVAVDVVADLADGSLRPFARGARHEWWCASTPSSGSRLPRVVASAGWPAGRPEGPLRCRRSAPHR